MPRAAFAVLCAVALPACLDPGAAGNLVPGTVDDDPTLPRIELADTALHAEAFGDPQAPLIIVLHGGPGGDYRSLLAYQALADDGYRVVFWDQRGSGLSRRHGGSTYTLDAYLEDLRVVIEHATTSATQPIVFLGHSWGAMYATWFIDTYGDYGGRVVGAILSEPGAFTSAGLAAYFASGFPPWGFTSEELGDVAWADQLMSPNDHARADYQLQVAALAGFPREHNDPDNPAPTWRQGAVVNAALRDLGARGFDWTTHLDEFTHPVLFLRGERNENLPLAHQQALAASYADAEVITVPGAGHEAIWEQPEEFLAQIRAYLAELP